MTIGLLKEPAPETRVSLLAEAVATLAKKNIPVLVERLAGENAFCSDAEYEKAGAQIKSRKEVIDSSDILLCIHPLTENELPSSSRIMLGVYHPLFNIDM